MYFPFLAAWVDRSTGYDEEAQFTKVCTAYSDIMNDEISDNVTEGWSENSLRTFEGYISRFKTFMY